MIIYIVYIPYTLTICIQALPLYSISQYKNYQSHDKLIKRTMGNAVWIRSAVIAGDLNTVKKLLDEATATATHQDGVADGEGIVVRAQDTGDGSKPVNMPFIFDMTPLHYACQYGREEIAVELLTRGASLQRKDIYIGYTPLQWVTKLSLR